MLDLAGTWELCDARGEFAAPMTVPGDGISALHAAGLIPDPYWGRNEYDLRWIADRDWTITRKFTVEQDRPCWTVFADGLDCVAEIRINGTLVLEAANAFRPHEAEITEHIHPGENQIAITFRSNTQAANAAQARQPFRVPYHDGNCPIPNGNMLRKQQCDFGWDWNIALAPFGLYGAIRICGDDPTDLRDVMVAQTHDDGTVDLDITVDVETFTDEPVAYSISFNGKTIEGFCEGPILAGFTIENPRLWWPNGAGAQDLYTLTVTVGQQTRTLKIALRDIQLISEPDEAGRSFGFTVNGRAMFAKGANWIPADALAGRITDANTKALLTSAKDANMNMIRVWGGGRYETDQFYEDCDALGLLVWQDAMFSCNLYPADESFLAEIHAEIEYQARRLHHRVALWCGDNELIGALTWFPESVENRDRYLVAYDRLNRSIEQAVGDANWWPSSPSPGPMSFGDAWHDDSAGDMHFWSVWHEGRDFEHYRDVRPRFCSEFGFQSFPSMPVIRHFADEKDLNISSPVMESHQKNAGGNARIAETMFRYFRFPQSFENFVYLSQIQQGIAIKTAVDFWRSQRPHTMGALYWQLNDTWPCASWSSLNHGGSWKALHYMAKRFFAPISVALIPNGDHVSAHVMNDTNSNCTGLLHVDEYDLAGTILHSHAFEIDVPADAVMGQPIEQPIDSHNFLAARFVVDDAVAATDTWPVSRFKELDLQDPKLTHVTQLHDCEIHIELTAKAPAFYFMLETPIAGQFSDNAITVLPNRPQTIVFRPNDTRHLQAAADALQSTDLFTATYR